MLNEMFATFLRCEEWLVISIDCGRGGVGTGVGDWVGMGFG